VRFGAYSICEPQPELAAGRLFGENVSHTKLACRALSVRSLFCSRCLITISFFVLFDLKGGPKKSGPFGRILLLYSELAGCQRLVSCPIYGVLGTRFNGWPHWQILPLGHEHWANLHQSTFNVFTFENEI